MLKVFALENPHEKFKQLDDFDIDRQTWVVADLNTKNYIQSELLKKVLCLPEDAVLRVSELWRKILRQKHPDFELASSQFIAVLLAEWLRERDLAWARHPGTSRTLVQYMGEFLPILASESLTERVREWLRENPEALMRWGHWFELSVEAWAFFCEQKILAPQWVSAFLSAHTEDRDILWSRELFFDVGAEIVGSEIELLRSVARTQKVNLFSPTDKWVSRYRGTLWPYEILSGRVVQDASLGAIDRDVHCHRFTTQIAEVKSAVAQLRQWLDAGVALKDVGVFAADIEAYWFALEPYLAKEGIAVNKDVVSSVASWPSVSRWLARLKVESREIESGHLESVAYEGVDAPQVKFEKFQQLFSHVYDEQDLDRESRVRELFQFAFTSEDLIQRDEFLAWALPYYGDDARGLERVVAEFLLECPKGFRLQLASWVSYLSGLIAKSEIKIGDGHENGIWCGNFDSALNVNVKKVILLGLCEANLRDSSDLSVQTSDVKKLAQDLGVYIDSPDQEYNEYLVHQLALAVPEEIHFYYSATDFGGQVQAPSLIWLQTAMARDHEIEKYEVPASTRWDEIQMHPATAIPRADLKKYILQDLGLEPADSFAPARELRFSASQIEKYLKCPFIFAAEKVFHLSDLPNVDLDVDAMTGGRILHGVLDKLLDAPLRFEQADDELAQMIDEVRDQMDVPVGDARLWPVKRQYYLQVAQKFMRFEKDWRSQHPKLKTVARELLIEGKMTLDESTQVQVSGRIDRVDAYYSDSASTEMVAPEYVVIDYKSRPNQLRNHGSWLANNELQLAFYTLALSEGLSELKAGPVLGAFYFAISSMNREKGFRLVGHENKLYGPNTRNRSQLSDEALLKLLGEVKVRLAEVVKNISAGHLAPQPQDLKTCNDCHWRTLCRAPHLN